MPYLDDRQMGFRFTDTSRDAAESMRPVLNDLQADVMVTLRDMGEATADEVAARMQASVLRIRPRFTELRAKARVQDTGQRRPNTSGRRAIVWRALP